MSKKKFLCTFTDCKKSFGSQSKLNDHVSTHTKTPKYPCTKCDKIYYRKYHLQRHFIVHTKESKYECENCGVKQYERCKFMQHKKQCGVTYPCMTCDRTFSQSVYLRLHKCKSKIAVKTEVSTNLEIKNMDSITDKQAIDDIVQASTNDKINNTDSVIDDNMSNKTMQNAQKTEDVATNTVYKNLQVDTSQKKNITKKQESSSKKETKIKRGTNELLVNDSLYSCLHCEKSYTTKKSLNTHKRAKHEPTQKYVCECGKKYFYNHNMKQHKVKCKLLDSSIEMQINDKMADK